MNAREIIKKYLDDNGYDGLCGDNCGCDKDDLAPCCMDDNCLDCKPAYKTKSNCSECSNQEYCSVMNESEFCYREEKP